jgi:hypothetical protein
MSVPVNTIFSSKGTGIGRVLMNEVIGHLGSSAYFVQFMDDVVHPDIRTCSVDRAYLSAKDGGVDNFDRRYAFYSGCGFSIEYTDNVEGYV